MLSLNLHKSSYICSVDSESYAYKKTFAFQRILAWEQGHREVKLHVLPSQHFEVIKRSCRFNYTFEHHKKHYKNIISFNLLFPLARRLYELLIMNDFIWVNFIFMVFHTFLLFYSFGKTSVWHPHDIHVCLCLFRRKGVPKGSLSILFLYKYKH